MHAPCADTRPTTPNPASLSHEFFPIVTPLIADAWEDALRQANCLHTYIDVPYGLRFGFDMGIHTLPSSTYIPPNHSSAINHPHAVMSNIQTELAHRRYSGPFAPDRLELLIGPFRSSPLGVIPKTGTNEFRLIQDFSYPRNDPSLTSVNAEIDLENLHCDWGTFQEAVAIILDAPPLALAATLDVDSAFRRCPIQPSQRPNFVIYWQGHCYIDHNAPFGAASSGFIFGRIADALTAILRSRGIGPVINWVDDFLFFLFPTNPKRNDSDEPFYTPLYPYSLDTIHALATFLGLPWKHSKTRPFASTFKYLGFLWDLTDKTVQIPDEKKRRYLEKLAPWIKGAKFTKRDTESLLGTLVHCALAIPNARSRLPSLSRFASSFQNTQSPFIRKSPSPAVLSDIDWWRNQLSAPFCGSTLVRPPPPSPIEFWVDASTTWGVGVVFNNAWDAWELQEGWKGNGRTIGWAEFIAIELGLLLAISQGHSNTHFLIRSDNQGVIFAIKGGKSRSPEQNAVLQRITQLLSTHSLWISSLYVRSADNIADGPSRGHPPSNLPRSRTRLTIPSSLTPFLITNT